MTKRPVLTLLYSTASYDFVNIIGHKKELNKLIQIKLNENEIRISKGIINAKKQNIG